jgi:hypothetical protein
MAGLPRPRQARLRVRRSSPSNSSLLACAALLLLLLGCVQRPAAGAAAQVRAVPLVAADGAALPHRIGALELLGAYELQSRDRDFGGISAARLQGDRLLLLSDRSHLFELGWTVHGAGQPFTMPLRRERELTTAQGRPLDAEAMVVGPGDELLVGDEETGRLFAFGRGPAMPVRHPVDLPGPFAEHRPTNEGVEALARLPDGSLLALSEGAWEQDGLHSLVRVGDDGAQLLQYRCPQGFQPTDADVAGGRLFVLERRISLLRGWQSRVVAVPLETLDDPAATAIQGQELAVISGAGLGENYEALSVEQTPDGAFRMLIVADDNFNEFQRTQLLELGWRP